ncbi:MAG: glycosyltransferase family 2 protein [Wenzhouxiangellaceae bacterium]
MSSSRTAFWPTIVIPVFNAPGALARCIAATAATLPGDARVIVIDDASNAPGVAAVLEQCPSEWRRIRHARNRGFVATANHGMQLAGDADVLLLNSDTVPAGRWLERMRAALDADARVASVTPFTNNGEIASLPDFCRAAPVPDDVGRWAEACLQAGPPGYPEIPTAVGFCMLLRRTCLDQVGAFDAEAFGRGYGEENDWCMRARAAGWRHVLCDDAFVAHQGNASFGPLGLGPDDSAMQRLLARHPGYLDEVRRFIDADPLSDARRRVLDQLSRA